MRPIAAARDGQRNRSFRIGQSKMQCGERAHREPDYVRALDAERIEHAADVVPCARLRITLDVLRHVRRRVSAGVVGDAAVAAREMAQLRLPAAMVAAELVNEHDRRAGAGFLVVELYAVIGGERRHMAFYVDDSRCLQAVRAS